MKEKDWFDVLINSPLQLSLDQLLAMVPAFKHRLLRKLQNSGEPQYGSAQQEVMLHNVDPENVDFIAPVIAVLFHGRRFDEVLLDGGSGVNILPESVFRELQIDVAYLLLPSKFVWLIREGYSHWAFYQNKRLILQV